MFRVGLTGGIGSGKSTVCRVFSALGIPVYDSDARAKALMDSEERLKEEITALLGPQAYTGGRLDRAFVASRVFGDSGLLGQLNHIVHPAVGRDFIRWSGSMEREGHPYVLMESAILFESGFDKFADVTVTVSAPEEVRIARVVNRDPAQPDSVRARMASQLSDAGREARADHTIVNDGQCRVLPRILELHEIFRNESGK